MATHNWCHNPKCHTYKTTDRVRGSGNNKVLRTRKIKANRYGDYQANIWNYFCNQGCLMAFLNKFGQEIAQTYSVKKPSETLIKVKKEKYESSRYNWNGENGPERVPYMATRTTIEKGDND